MAKRNKRRMLHVHASRRAAQRYSIRLTEHQETEIVRAIRQGKSRCVEKQSHRVSVHDVEVEGRPVRVVYDCTRKCLVTFLHIREEVTSGS